MRRRTFEWVSNGVSSKWYRWRWYYKGRERKGVVHDGSWNTKLESELRIRLAIWLKDVHEWIKEADTSLHPTLPYNCCGKSTRRLCQVPCKHESKPYSTKKVFPITKYRQRRLKNAQHTITRNLIYLWQSKFLSLSSMPLKFGRCCLLSWSRLCSLSHSSILPFVPLPQCMHGWFRAARPG